MDSDPVESLAFTAMMHEYDFVSSLIRFYRQTQMRVVQFGLTLYAATAGLVGALGHDNGLLETALVAAALIAWPFALLVLCFMVAEIRLRRASLFIRDTLAPQVNALLRRMQPNTVLTFERDPGIHLTRAERQMSGSAWFVIMLSGPALVAAIWAFVMTDPQLIGIKAVAAIGALTLTVVMILTVRFSQHHETRSSRKLSVQTHRPA